MGGTGGDGPAPSIACSNLACSLAGRAGLTQPLLSYAAWAAASARARSQPVRHIWGSSLRQVRGVSGTLADALVAAFPTPRSLFLRYAGLKDPTREGPKLLENFTYADRRVGPAVSERIFDAIWGAGAVGTAEEEEEEGGGERNTFQFEDDE